MKCNKIHMSSLLAQSAYLQEQFIRLIIYIIAAVVHWAFGDFHTHTHSNGVLICFLYVYLIRIEYVYGQQTQKCEIVLFYRMGDNANNRTMKRDLLWTAVFRMFYCPPVYVCMCVFESMAKYSKLFEFAPHVL